MLPERLRGLLGARAIDIYVFIIAYHIIISLPSIYVFIIAYYTHPQTPPHPRGRPFQPVARAPTCGRSRRIRARARRPKRACNLCKIPCNAVYKVMFKSWGEAIMIILILIASIASQFQYKSEHAPGRGGTAGPRQTTPPPINY